MDLTLAENTPTTPTAPTTSTTHRHPFFRSFVLLGSFVLLCQYYCPKHLELHGVFERLDGFRQHSFVVVARAEVPVGDGEVGPDGNGGLVARRRLEMFSGFSWWLVWWVMWSFQ